MERTRRLFVPITLSFLSTSLLQTDIPPMKQLLKNGEPISPQELAENMETVRDAGCRTTHQFIDLVEREGRIEANGETFSYEDPANIEDEEEDE